MPPIAALLPERRYSTVVATQGWNPANYVSFHSQHAGKLPFEAILQHERLQVLGPDHCLQGCDRAALHPGVDWTLPDLILRKRTRLEVNFCSAFRERHGTDGSRSATGVAGWLHKHCIREVNGGPRRR